MNIIIAQDYAEMSRAAAGALLQTVRRQPRAVLILASGATPRGTYAEVARRTQAGEADFSQAHVFILDEWGGLPHAHPESCFTALRTQVVEPLGLRPEQFHSLDGTAADPDAECRRYASELAAAGPATLALVGLGVNGHIGFNEPADTLPASAAVTHLAAETQARLAPALGGALPPHYGLTLSLVEVLQAAHVILVANGDNKREAVRQMLTGPLTPHCPASLLRLHPNATVVLDEAAAATVPAPAEAAL